MKKRLFIYPALILFAGLLSFFVLSARISQINHLNMAKNTAMETTRILANLYDENMDLQSFAVAGQSTRISIISSTGYLLADSLAPYDDFQENRLMRPEIQAALNGSPESFVRHSTSLGMDYVYYALKIDTGDSYIFIRAAIAVEQVNAFFLESSGLLLLLLLIICALCFAIIRGIINRVTKPFEAIEKKLRLIGEGEYKTEPPGNSYEEITAINRTIDEVALMLHNSFTALKDEKFKLEYILNNIGDGIFVVDENKSIVLINEAAGTIFDAGLYISGKSLHYLSFDESLEKAVNDCISYERSALLELKIKERIFLTAIKRLPDTTLTMTVLTDVTESRENSKRREEFFANASHELKTPLTAIKGFNELMSINNRDECMNKYIDSITRETNRMLVLIADMLKLSELESTLDVKATPVSLRKIADEVHEMLFVAISEKSITFDLTGNALINADPEHVYELVKNLIENAVRYSNPGGKVSVKIEKSKRLTRLAVIDNGIGISPGEQSRIFERFYRIEKSRSGRGGGTGLGLSIVKHVCSLYGWNLSLKSKPGMGTEMAVEFANIVN